MGRYFRNLYQGRDHPSKKYALKELLERKCSDYFRVSIYESDGGASIYTNNFIDSHPASVICSVWDTSVSPWESAMGLMAVLLGIMKWICWLLRD